MRTADTTLDGYDLQLGGVTLRDAMVPVDGELALHHVEAGPADGKPVLLLHGFPDFWRAWGEQLPHLAQRGLRVLAPDLPGYNLSGKPRTLEESRPGHVAQLLAHYVRAVAPGKRVTVVGHDWGANLGWRVAIEHPDVVEKLITLGAGHPGDYDLRTMGADQLRRSWYILFMRLPRFPEWLLPRADYRVLRKNFRRQGVSAEMVDLLISNLRKHPETLTPMVDYYRAATKHRTVGRFPTVEVPVLALHARDDRHTSLGLMEKGRAHARDFRLVELDGGHWAHVAPASAARVNQLLCDFIDG